MISIKGTCLRPLLCTMIKGCGCRRPDQCINFGTRRSNPYYVQFYTEKEAPTVNQIWDHSGVAGLCEWGHCRGTKWVKALQGHQLNECTTGAPTDWRHYRGNNWVKALQRHRFSEGTTGAPTEWRHYRGTNWVKALQGQQLSEGTTGAPTEWRYYRGNN